MTAPAMQKLVLYAAVPSRAAIVHWMLEELGEPYELRVLSLSKQEQKSPAYLAVNPMGKVPALKDGDVIVTEVAAICCYLADTYPRARLAPPIGDPLRGPYLKWLFFGPSCFEPAVMEKAFGWQAPRPGSTGWGSLDTVLDVLDAALDKGPYLLGDKFTTADVVIGSDLWWGMTMFKTVPERPRFKAYVERLTQRPAWQRYEAQQTELMQKTIS